MVRVQGMIDKNGRTLRRFQDRPPRPPIRSCAFLPNGLTELCYLGVDLGASLSLSAACAVWESGRVEWWHAASTIPEPLERGRRDGCGTL